MNNTSVFPVYGAVDRLFAGIYLVIGYAFIYVFTGSYDTWSLSVFTVFYAAMVLTYVYGRNKRPVKESWFWLAVLLAIGIPFAFWSVLQVFQILALMLVAAYWTLLVTGKMLQQERTSRWVFFDCWNAVAVVPFMNFGCQFRVLLGMDQEEKEGRKKSQTGAVLLGVVIAVPVLLIILPLLSSADAGFARLAGEFTRYLLTHTLAILLRIPFAILVSCYLFGLIFGGISGRNTDRIQTERLQQVGEKIRRVPDVTICTMLVIVCFVYMLFIGIQGNYLVSAFMGRLPEDFTYAEYARRGFFELCRIGVWNLLILGSAGIFSRSRIREHRGLKVLTLLLSLLTLFLIGTAISKLGMYISVYGLTVNRIIPMVFMVWMMIVFVAVILWQKKEFELVRVCVMVGAVLFCLLCVFPVEDWTEGYNAWARMRGMIR